MAEADTFSIQILESDAGQRLDSLLSNQFPHQTRSHIAALIRCGLITVHSRTCKPGYRVKTGETVSGRFPPPESIEAVPQPIDLMPVFEDDHILVINKQPGLVVHPAPGHFSGTLVNAVLYHCSDLPGIGGKIRPGIVHRLDKDTSGLLVIAKTDTAHLHLSDQFKQRTIHKTYLTLVYGRLHPDHGMIELPIGRHPTDRKKMSVHSRTGRQAVTQWQVRERFLNATFLEVQIHTGRTHQIRVHMAAVGNPVIGDPIYGGNKKRTSSMITASRQLLHAWKLGFIHPATGNRIVFEAPIPPDMNHLLETLRRSAR